jgi:acyl-CoA thioester hydrolase
MDAANLGLYKLKLPVQIRFVDFDSLGHVNNASYFTYLEEARVKYFGEVITGGEIDWWKNGIILARMEIDFRKPITGYNHYFVYIRCSRIGNKSFDFSYTITREENSTAEMIAEAKSVMVCYDYDKNETIAMREDWKDKVKTFESLKDPSTG